MTDLFSTTGPRRLDMPGADVTYYAAPDLGASADELFARLMDETPWEQRSITIQGREIPQPRLVSWHGDADYTYSGLKLAPNPWTPMLAGLRHRLQEICDAKFNSVLLNRYRSGKDSVGMHADNEKELRDRPLIASISLGAERVFDMRRADGTGSTVHIPLEHGSLVVMAGTTQKFWKHGIAKTTKPVGERINLTFRLTYPR